MFTIKVTPVRELGDPHNLNVTPKATDKTVLFSDLSVEEQQAAIYAAMSLGGEICIVTIDDAIVVVKGYNDEHEEMSWGSNQPPRYALFNAKQHPIRSHPYDNDYVFAFIQMDSTANRCRFRAYFKLCPGAVD